MLTLGTLTCKQRGQEENCAHICVYSLTTSTYWIQRCAPAWTVACSYICKYVVGLLSIYNESCT
ncbi:hypothetical protein CSUI_003033 [Cystoisospora suis]|uniref:Uncharacterized protein n=1 Tax=Cystoisospora suis TaxID=483139 RepID=A0A2C6L2F6_9APIC|nr:hypothetical protein CSUI_003033 [Cystoisospora suis]